MDGISIDEMDLQLQSNELTAADRDFLEKKKKKLMDRNPTLVVSPLPLPLQSFITIFSKGRGDSLFPLEILEPNSWSEFGLA